VFWQFNFFYIIDDWTASAFPLANFYWAVLAQGP